MSQMKQNRQYGRNAFLAQTWEIDKKTNKNKTKTKTIQSHPVG